ncbi:[protein-PII] uridylyltransferase [Beijerinckia indica]|uniref:Bifunctional uridylyltransferase/uridylyl-removing enzyme n=1 Tax=Beijerinckia indica subsp. indica (strain ATCC 9039 / DSM 1715 / NCIMB 8712) TaxID=395963 RepID=B2IC91_BEII9|nr:[protein-PII] uridylyltransferase [Beijerinckia indica]ACB96688.1 UTP-GlnB uridylyltransferase, GlnD [Beijerinckia indica subsp. indica ATCC 9039]
MSGILEMDQEKGAPPAKQKRGRSAPKIRALFNRSRLREEIAALHAGCTSSDEKRNEVVALLRQALADGRALARQNLEAKGSGLACASQIAHIEDELFHAIHAYVTTYVHKPPHARAARLAIAAVGGYGRATLAPGSDIDILFLLPDSNPAEREWNERVVQAILYLLWDLRQKVGYSTRLLSECLEQAREDMTVRTALLEARFLLGNKKLFETMRRRFDDEIVSGTAPEFVSAKLEEREARISRAGRSRFLVEPNVKEGKGGLRDLNTLFWIAKYVYRVRTPAELVGAGLFSRSEYRLFYRCEEFLWRVRCHLHFLTGHAEERLSFDVQPMIADRLGYSTRGGLAQVERFMRHYFLIAKDVGDLTAIVCAALEERQAKPSAMLDRFAGPHLPREQAAIMGSFAIETNRVTVSSPDVFERDPINLIRLFWLADRNGLAIHPDAKRLVTQSLKRIDSKVRQNREANRLFLEILTSRNTPEIVLRLMNEAGVLGRFIEPFGRILALMQFNMYHHYTVDEHLLRAVGHLADIENHRRLDDHPFASHVMASVGNRRALYLALFLHDIGKGREEDHSLAGIEVARKLCPRLGLSEAETETVAWLIENHLVMSDTAQRRDLSDRRTIETFARCVQTLERLKMLFLLTICDIRAVGPGVWNNWKGELLRTLYWETEVVLTGGHSAMKRKGRIEKAKAELRRALSGWSEADFAAYAVRLPNAYWLKVDLPHQILHARLLNMSEIEMVGPLTHTLTDAQRGVTELTVIAPDHPNLLSTIAGACAASAANIVDAQVFTTTDSMALDTITISRAFDFDEDELRRASRIALSIERALSGQISMRDIMVAKSEASPSKGRGATFKVHPEVSIDNSLSSRFTVIEVSGLDRTGLLYDLTRILSKANLNIGSAHIVTFGERVVDVFYVTDLHGAKITTAARQTAVRRQILGAFSPAPIVTDASSFSGKVA